MNLWKVVRAILGIVVIVCLGVVIMNWYKDFKASSERAAAMRSIETSSVASSDTATATVVLGTGVAKFDGVNFRVKPATSAKLIRVLKKGEKVTVILKDGQWYQVKDAATGKTGWITTDPDAVALQPK